MKIIEGKSLADFTTFRIGGNARFFCSVQSKEDLQKASDFAKEKKLPIFILGGGSNILVSDKGFDGLVVKIDMKGIEESKKQEGKSKNEGTILIRASAGENWDDFVGWAVDKGYGGLENLSLIPGSVGAAPVQNIGAYGVEVGSLIESVEVFDVKENIFKNISHDECHFSYRDSLFKHEKNRYVIISVLFKLKKNAEPDISYKDLKEYFEKDIEKVPSRKYLVPSQEKHDSQLGTRNLELTTPYTSSSLSSLRLSESNDLKLREPNGLNPTPSVSEVRQAIIAIRTAKLPDLSKVGTAGSFFKNPILSKQKYAELKEKYPELPNFPEADGRIKIPLAWIIDKVCGLKGKRFGNAGIHEAQALVIVNYGGATCEDVEKVASEVEKVVKEKTGIDIEREVIMV